MGHGGRGQTSHAERAWLRGAHRSAVRLSVRLRGKQRPRKFLLDLILGIFNSLLFFAPHFVKVAAGYFYNVGVV